MGFLPDNYDPPVGGNYLKLQTGDNRIRVLGAAIIGNMFWRGESDGSRKPVRRRPNEIIHENELGTDQYGNRERVRHFWAFPCYCYRSKQVQILEITQTSIMGAIDALDKSEDWGDPREYDINIHKSGSGLDTKYAVMPLPKAPLRDDIRQEYEAAKIDLTALYDGGDPFGAATNGNGQQAATPAPQAASTPAPGTGAGEREDARRRMFKSFMEEHGNDREAAAKAAEAVRLQLFPEKPKEELTAEDYMAIEAEAINLPF